MNSKKLNNSYLLKLSNKTTTTSTSNTGFYNGLCRKYDKNFVNQSNSDNRRDSFSGFDLNNDALIDFSNYLLKDIASCSSSNNNNNNNNKKSSSIVNIPLFEMNNKCQLKQYHNKKNENNLASKSSQKFPRLPRNEKSYGKFNKISNQN
jgi:hypothetical protein